MDKSCICCTNRFTFVLPCFSRRLTGYLARRESRMLTGIWTFLSAAPLCNTVCVTIWIPGLGDSVFKPLSVSLSFHWVFGLFKGHRVGGWRLLWLLWKMWMWAQLSLRQLEQLCDYSEFSLTHWGLIVSQKVRLSLQWMIDWQVELLHSVSFCLPHSVDYSVGIPFPDQLENSQV